MIKQYLQSLSIVMLPLGIAVVGQVSSKYGMVLKNTTTTTDGSLPPYLYFLAIGYLALIFRGAIWIRIVKKADLSIVYPLMSLALILIMGASYFLFNEPITLAKAMGALLIVGGTVLTSKTS